MTLEIEITNKTFILHNTGALYWTDKKMLLLSDVHLGKVSHFRKHGSAIPNNAILQNFKKLDAVVKHFEPESICFLGDLFHSSLNKEWILFEQWVNNTGIPLILIAGNHDIISPHKYEELNIAIHSEWILDGFLLTHHPENREGFFNLSGHVHPAVRLQGLGRQFLRLPCFFRNKNQMILPAFGEFTGTYIIEPLEGDIIYITTKEEVIKL
ncbi:ligase-associated DNA damage response endonuclease PdeM [Flavobacterium alkalisoli]|uniref:Ligase-associated DNA damage response endonuclease PdeM n=1 Tax=Flavobacterium alkalisoli TaxID=2602769 RepID=A0A5B9FV10_9FLAO|nr:ligase-associated DNA damage response endonuclease PdeM [Flavobacterium alkalisoli]QEE48582.1 ligase-associated DNA damage response endonuclease PdeM [Flavobacterium alkalisoli]